MEVVNNALRVAAQAELVFMDAEDRFGFLKGVSGNWNNHLPLLLLGLNLSRGKVVELGSGDGSTEHLRNYCTYYSRVFKSYDNNREWCNKTGACFVENWDAQIEGFKETRKGLIFIDHAPGERRSMDAMLLSNTADILVLHDTEEYGEGDYKWERAWPHFKFRLNYNRLGGGAGATAVSNTIDLNRFRGLSLGQYKFDDD